MHFGGNEYDFVTDRLAIGNVASRATPGFVAVVSILATDRPGTLACEVTGAPEVPNGAQVKLAWDEDEQDNIWRLMAQMRAVHAYRAYYRAEKRGHWPLPSGRGATRRSGSAKLAL